MVKTTPPRPEGEESSGRTLFGVALGASLALSFVVSFDWLGYGAQARSRGAPEVGEVSCCDIKAPADMTIVDPVATEAERRRATELSPVVYDFDERAGPAVRRSLADAFGAARELQVPGARPDRAAQSAAFRAVLAPGVETPDPVLAALAAADFANGEQVALLRLLEPVLARMVVDDRTAFERQFAQKRPVLARELGSTLERPLASAEGVLSVDSAQALVAEQAERALAGQRAPLRQSLLTLARLLIRPNLLLNLRATEERRETAASNVGDVTISLRKGEIIVRNGVRLSPRHVLILSAAQQETAGGAVVGFVGNALLILIVLCAGWSFARAGLPRFPHEMRDVAFLLSTLLATALGVKLSGFLCAAIAENPQFAAMLQESPRRLYYGIPVAAAAMLTRMVHNAETAVLIAVLTSLVAGLQTRSETSFVFFCLVGSLVAALGATRVTQRGTLLRAGVRVGLANVAVIGALALLENGIQAVPLVVSLGAGFVGGCLSGFIVSALAPLVESLFAYTTDVKLLELANREQPLLRDLELRAPGTYHHSMMVGHLAEKAAEAIGANALLAKVAGYYHDIGKMRRPHFFVENITVHQGENRHEKLSPSMSARIIQAHVKDGLELGRDSKLAPAILRGIGEHHGTSVIRFFYEKAKESLDPEKGEHIAEHDYRYPGPKPQTREAGILMLADSVEAASRTLSDTSPARIQQLVQRIINNYFRDGQLDDCSLTLRDLNAIARSFIDTLSAIRHERIDYPAPTDTEGRPLESADEGVGERAEPRSQARSERAAEQRPDDLKRLGLS